MKVIIPSFNNALWLRRTLGSVDMQDHPEFDVLIVDDASTDGSWEIVHEFCSRPHNHGNWEYIRNDVNRRAGYNLYHGIHSMLPAQDEPIFILDGDDFLPHEHVLSRIEEEYRDPNVWFCYGRYQPHPHNTGQVDSRPYPPEWINDAGNGRLRYEENLANHPITFRYFLFCGLDPADLCDDDGNWYRAGYDRLMFIPMLEMARHHHRFVDESLYCYNAVNPISDTFANLADAQAAHRAVVGRAPKKPMIRAHVP